MLNENFADLAKNLSSIYVLSLVNKDNIWLDADLYTTAMLQELAALGLIEYSKNKKFITITAEGVRVYLDLDFSEDVEKYL